MNALDILQLIENDEDYTFGCGAYGIRADRTGIEAGERFENSHEWSDTDPSEWGEEYADCELIGNMWDLGELNGTSSLAVDNYMTEDRIKAIIRQAHLYGVPGESSIYLIRGEYAEAGGDDGEAVIHSAECIGLIEDC